MAKWRIERWSEELKTLPREHYKRIQGRELAIVGASILDAALAEILDKRLSGDEQDRHSLLGANEDGRAPCGTFGARIQLGLVVGVLTPHSAALLRAIKNLRNIMAHRVNVDFTHGKPYDHICAVVDTFIEPFDANSPARWEVSSWRSRLRESEIANHALRGIFEVLEFGMDQLQAEIERIRPIVGGPS